MANKDNMLYARIRKDDHAIREHFNKVKNSDWAYEIRRLIEMGIAEEERQKNLLKKASDTDNTRSGE